MGRIHNYALALLLLMLSIFIGVLIYISLSNPKINPPSTQNKHFKENANNTTLTVSLQIGSLKNWKWDYLNDIDAADDYPLVRLRSGYKYLRNNDKDVILGWKYEVINASDKDLFVTVNYKITDEDNFELGSSSKK